MDFLEELTNLLNRYGKENESNTPDFILAAYIRHCLTAFNTVTAARDDWYKAGGNEEVGGENHD